MSDTGKRWLGAVGAVVLLAALAVWFLSRDAVSHRAASTPVKDEARDSLKPRPVTEEPGDRPTMVASPLEKRFIAGQVRDPRGEAVVGATVCSWPKFGEREVRFGEPSCAVSDNAGRYEIGVRWPGPVLVGAAAEGFMPRNADRPIDWRSRSSYELDFVLEPGGDTIEGRVVDIYGGGIEGAVVFDPYLHGVVARSADDGAFTVPGFLSPMPLEASASSYGRGVASPWKAKQTTIVLAPEAFVVATLRRADGSEAPLESARVVAGGIRAARSEDGSYVIGGLRPGSYDVEAVAKGARGRVDNVQVRAGESTEVELALERATDVTGVVFVDDTPCSTCRVGVEGLPGVRPQITEADAEGHFEFLALPSGEGTILARDSVSTAGTKTALHVHDGMKPITLEIDEAVSRLDVAVDGLEVLDLRGRDLGTLWACPSDGGPCVWASLGDGERVEFKPCSPGLTYDIKPDEGTGMYGSQRCECLAPDAPPVRCSLKLVEGAQVSGRVVDSAGKPWPGFVRWSAKDGPAGVVEPDSEGRFSLRVPPGVLTFRASRGPSSSPGEDGAGLIVEVAEHGLNDLVVKADAKRRVLTGEVLAEGEPLPGYPVVFQCLNEAGHPVWSKELTTDDRGRFELVSPPSCSLRASAGGTRASWMTIDDDAESARLSPS